QASGVMRPDKEWQGEPGHARRPHSVNRHNEIQAGENRRESGDEDAAGCYRYPGVGIRTAIRRVESPTGIDTPEDRNEHSEAAPDYEDVPARQIQTGEG